MMDGCSSDHSRAVSENTNGSWNWDMEDVSISRLHLGVPEPSDDLLDLVEDKEIAACAVAFVVNGTRRGIVPLCADVASLMRSKRRLEKRIVRLKREVEAFRRVSQHSSHSLSPTPTSLHSYSSSRGSFMDPAHVQVFNELLQGAQCSDVTSHSSDSSQIGSSPTPHRRTRGGLHRTTTCVPIRNQLAPVTVHRSVGDVRSTNHQVEVYESVCDDDIAIGHDKPALCADEVDLSADSALHFDSGIENGSLSSQVVDCPSFRDKGKGRGVVDTELDKMTPDKQSSLAARSSCCCLNSTSGMSLEDRFNKTMEANMKLAHELATTRRQMELLTTKLREFELHELSHREGCSKSYGRQANNVAEASSSTNNLLSASASASSIGETESTLSRDNDTQDVKSQQLVQSVINRDEVIEVIRSDDAVIGMDIDLSTSDKSCTSLTKQPPDGRSTRSVLRPLHRSKALNNSAVDGAPYVDSYV